MKYFDGKRGLLRAVALAQVLLLAVTGCKSSVNKSENDVFVGQALVGKDGARTINAANTIVNTYSALAADAAALTSAVTVNAIADLAADLGTGGGLQPLAVGDLLLIIQMAGATIATADTVTGGI
jgi:ABC-type phosphate transport system substrate-binding protein